MMVNVFFGIINTGWAKISVISAVLYSTRRVMILAHPDNYKICNVQYNISINESCLE